MRLRGTTRTGIVLRYYLYMAASSAGFFAPVWVVLLEQRGLTFTQITILDSAFFLSIILSEIPTGYVGDRIGRRNALLVGTLGVGVAATLFGFVTTFEGFLVDYVLWGVFQTFRSGNDSAWLYDTLAEYGEEADYARVEGRGRSMLFAVTAVTALAGGRLFELDPRFPFVATGGLIAVSALVLLSLPEPTVEEAEGGFTVRDALGAMRPLLSPPLRSFVIYVGLFFASAMSVTIFIQPISTRAGLSAGDLGVLYAGFTLASAAASASAGRIEDSIGIRRWVHWTPIVLGFLFLLPLAAPILAIPMFFLLRIALDASTPLTNRYLNDRTASLGRATVLSTVSMVVSVVKIPIRIASGVVADATSLFVAVAGLGVVLVVASLVVLAVEAPVEE